jgi:hypothetical protein
MKAVTKWKDITNSLTEFWVRRYFHLDKDEEVDFSWVDIGGVFCFADYWVDFNTVLYCLENNVEEDKFFDWYDHSILVGGGVSLQDFLISPQKRLEQEQKYIAELKEKVKTAEEELKKAIKNYAPLLQQ